MINIEFSVNGKPKGQPRPRAFARRFGDKFSARVYDPGTADGWKEDVRAAARPFRPPTPIERGVAVRMELHFRLPRPNGHFGSGKNSGVLKASAPGYFTAKPDVDNLAKAVLDVMGSDRWWHDDAQVVALLITKRYAYTHEAAGCTISISVD